MSIDKLLSIFDKSEQVKKTKAIRDIKKENVNSDTILRDIKESCMNQIKKDYYKLVRIGDAISRNYIEYESNGDRGKTLFTDLDMIRQYLSDIINDHKT